VEHRVLGRSGRQVAVVGLGAWQLGADWGDVDESQAFAVLSAAVESGVDFFDTADVYGDGRSEQLIGRFLKEQPDVAVTVATKMGRRLPQDPSIYTLSNFRAWTDRSRANLGVDTLDLVQLHCPPTEVFYMPEVFGVLDDLKAAGKIQHYGVSVEKVEEALKAIEYPGVQSVQIIFNIFRQRPAELFFSEAKRRKVGILARLPLSSGMLLVR
jgi:aryl-alcohol dehydrogenase-like predicted oxidoreductase